MLDNVFIDTNLWIYRYSGKTQKRKVATDLIQRERSKIIVSVQVLNECFNALIRKKIASTNEAQTIVENIART